MKVVLPPEFVAVIVYELEDIVTVGVPEMIPVAASNESPVGKLGDTEYEIPDPVTVGVIGVIAELLAQIFGVVYERDDGAISFTEIVKSNVVLPPVFEAVTV